MTNFKKIEKIIVADGWVLVRVNGSHYQYKHPVNPNTIKICLLASLKISKALPGYLSGDNPVATIFNIMRKRNIIR